MAEDKLAEDKFVEMQETKKAAKVLQRKRAAAKEVEQETRKAAPSLLSMLKSSSDLTTD